MTWFQKVLFTFAKVSLSTPPWMFKFVHPPTMVMMKELAKPLIRDYIEGKQETSSASGHSRRSVVIDALNAPSSGTEGERMDFETLSEEVVTLLTAGGDTVSSALIFGVYHICRHARVYEALSKELLEMFPAKTGISYEEAKQLPYLVYILFPIM